MLIKHNLMPFRSRIQGQFKAMQNLSIHHTRCSHCHQIL